MKYPKPQTKARRAIQNVVRDSFFKVLCSLLSLSSKPLPHNRRTHDLHLTMKKAPKKKKTVPCGKFSAQLSMSFTNRFVNHF